MRFCRGLALAALLAVGLLVPQKASAQCFQSQLDYDFLLGNLETIINTQIPNWTAASAWQNVLYQQGPGFAGVDNDSNGIDDDDHFDLLAAIINGTSTSLTGISQADIDTIRAAFAYNTSHVQTLELCIPNVTVKASIITAYQGTVCTNSTISALGQTVNVPSLWTLLSQQSPLLHDGLINLVGAYMTIGEDNGTQHLRSLLQVVFQRFIIDVLPKLIRTDPVSGGRACSPNINTNVVTNGITLNIIINGCDLPTIVKATQAAIAVAKDVPGLLTISAGNYGGRLGKSFIYLHPEKQPT